MRLDRVVVIDRNAVLSLDRDRRSHHRRDGVAARAALGRGGVGLRPIERRDEVGVVRRALVADLHQPRCVAGLLVALGHHQRDRLAVGRIDYLVNA